MICPVSDAAREAAQEIAGARYFVAGGWDLP
jgi:hypothetical protein